MRPAGEARFANVRKLMRLAGEFEEREGRDLRGLLDFLAARAEADAEAQAATAAEGHDGVRIMTVHNAKGLEFDVVAVPDLSRSLLAGGRPPLLLLWGASSRRGWGCSCAGSAARAVNLYDYGDAARGGREARDSEEGLRLFHVAATRARAAADPQRRRQTGAGEGSEAGHTGDRAPGRGARGRPRDADGEVAVPAPEPRAGPRGELRPVARSRSASTSPPPSGPPSCGSCAATPPPTASSARARRRWSSASRRSSPAAPSPTPRSPPTRNAPTASTWSGCWACRRPTQLVHCIAGSMRRRARGEGPSAREERSARGAAVHALLEWSQANGWPEPTAELARRHARRGRARRRTASTPAELLGPMRAWLGSALRERIGGGDAGPGRGADPARRRRHRPARLDRPAGRARGGAAAGRRLQDRPPRAAPTPAEHAARYEIQRSIYALAAAEALGVAEVEVAYVFLERPERAGPRPCSAPTEMDAPAAPRLERAIARIGAGEFPVAPPERRDWALCRGCPALGSLCSGPEAPDQRLTLGRQAPRTCPARERPRYAELRGQEASASRRAAELVQLQLLQPLAHRVELAGAVVDQLAALAAEVEGLAQARLARVEAVDDLLQPLDRGLVARGRLSSSSPRSGLRRLWRRPVHRRTAG